MAAFAGISSVRTCTSIECLFCGKPVIASDLGEIPAILDDGEGNKAGILFSLEDGHVPEGTLTDIICSLANDDRLYSDLIPIVKRASEKLDIGKVAERYGELYSEALPGRAPARDTG